MTGDRKMNYVLQVDESGVASPVLMRAHILRKWKDTDEEVEMAIHENFEVVDGGYCTLIKEKKLAILDPTVIDGKIATFYVQATELMTAQDFLQNRTIPIRCNLYPKVGDIMTAATMLAGGGIPGTPGIPGYKGNPICCRCMLNVAFPVKVVLNPASLKEIELKSIKDPPVVFKAELQFMNPGSRQWEPLNDEHFKIHVEIYEHECVRVVNKNDDPGPIDFKVSLVKSLPPGTEPVDLGDIEIFAVGFENYGSPLVIPIKGKPLVAQLELEIEKPGWKKKTINVGALAGLDIEMLAQIAEQGGEITASLMGSHASGDLTVNEPLRDYEATLTINGEKYQNHPSDSNTCTFVIKPKGASESAGKNHLSLPEQSVELIDEMKTFLDYILNRAKIIDDTIVYSKAREYVTEVVRFCAKEMMLDVTLQDIMKRLKAVRLFLGIICLTRRDIKDTLQMRTDAIDRLRDNLIGFMIDGVSFGYKAYKGEIKTGTSAAREAAEAEARDLAKKIAEKVEKKIQVNVEELTKSLVELEGKNRSLFSRMDQLIDVVDDLERKIKGPDFFKDGINEWMTKKVELERLFAIDYIKDIEKMVQTRARKELYSHLQMQVSLLEAQGKADDVFAALEQWLTSSRGSIPMQEKILDDIYFREMSTLETKLTRLREIFGRMIDKDAAHLMEKEITPLSLELQKQLNIIKSAMIEKEKRELALETLKDVAQDIVENIGGSASGSSFKYVQELECGRQKCQTSQYRSYSVLPMSDIQMLHFSPFPHMLNPMGLTLGEAIEEDSAFGRAPKGDPESALKAMNELISGSITFVTWLVCQVVGLIARLAQLIIDWFGSTNAVWPWLDENTRSIGKEAAERCGLDSSYFSSSEKLRSAILDLQKRLKSADAIPEVTLDTRKEVKSQVRASEKQTLDAIVTPQAKNLNQFIIDICLKALDPEKIGEATLSEEYEEDYKYEQVRGFLQKVVQGKNSYMQGLAMHGQSLPDWVRSAPGIAWNNWSWVAFDAMIEWIQICLVSFIEILAAALMFFGVIGVLGATSGLLTKEIATLIIDAVRVAIANNAVIPAINGLAEDYAIIQALAYDYLIGSDE